MPLSRHISVVIVPHTGGAARPYLVRRWVLVGAVVLVAALVLGLGGTALYYALLYNDTVHELKPLEERGDFLARRVSEYKEAAMISGSELSALRAAAERDKRAYEHSMRNIRLQLTQLQNFYKNLRIMAGFKLEEEQAADLLGQGGGTGLPLGRSEPPRSEDERVAVTTFGLNFVNHDTEEYAAAEAALLSDMAGLSQDMYELVRELEKRISTISPDVPYGVPVQGVITSYFGEPRWHGSHKGLDIAAPIGTPVRTPASGIVVESGFKGAYGLTIWVDHGNGYQTRYAHLSTVAYQVGERVNAGQVVGAIGITGATTGPHLHYEVRLNGIAVDPIYYMVQ
jgi:murein DD-endopeptidase MepM/ murein hydrolase activator NlpD